MDSDSISSIEDSPNCTDNAMSSDVREIKLMLLSGDKKQIIQSIEKIKVYLNEESTLVYLITSDIAEFLCDVIKPFDNIVCR